MKIFQCKNVNVFLTNETIVQIFVYRYNFTYSKFEAGTCNILQNEGFERVCCICGCNVYIYKEQKNILKMNKEVGMLELIQVE